MADDYRVTVAEVGERTDENIKTCLDIIEKGGAVNMRTAAIELPVAPIVVLARHAKQVAEGAGAASLAAAIKLRDRLRGKKVVGILTGGNIPLERFRKLMPRAA